MWAEGQLGGWLHRVAYRIAVRASIDAAAARARTSEQRRCRRWKSRRPMPTTIYTRALHEELAGCRRNFECRSSSAISKG